MSHLHFYINGTIGGKDGTEITSLTVKNLFNGISGVRDAHDYPPKALGFTIIPIFMRMETGYTAKSITLIGNGTANYESCPGIAPFRSFPTDSLNFNGGESNFYTTKWDDNYAVGDTNVLTFLLIRLNTSNYNIPADSTLLQISYQEDKVS